MKKVFTTLVLLLACTAMGFAVEKFYVIGDFTTNGWDNNGNPATPDEMTFNGTTNAFEYEFTSTGTVYFAFSDTDTPGTWANFNDNNRYAIGSSNQKATLDTETQLVKVDGTVFLEGAGEYLISVTKEDLKMTITKKAEAIITIDKVEILGGWTSWETNREIGELTKGDGNVWTGTIDLSTTVADQSFKLVVNTTNWIGSKQLTLEAEGIAQEGANKEDNIKLLNSAGTYKTYTVTATWDGNSESAAQGWTLTIAGKDARPTHTATFVNGALWENVYAYAWQGDGGSAVKLTGEMPGVKLSKTGTTTIGGNEYDVYTFSLPSNTTNTPEKILFNNNDGVQTKDMVFTEGKQYTMTVPQDLTGYYLITNDGTGWTVSATSMEENGSAYTATVSGTGKLFAIAPNTALYDNDIYDWSKVLRPKCIGNDDQYLVEYFKNYTDDIVTGTNNVWKVADNNDATLTLNFFPAPEKFTLFTNAKETVTIAAGNDGYATFSTSSGDYQIDGVDIFIVSAAEARATLTKIDADKAIPANTGIIINGAAGTYDVTPKNVNIDNADVSANLLVGSNANTYDITGDFGSGENRYYDGYIMANATKGVGFYKVSATNNTLAKNKAFLAANRRNSQNAPATLDFISFLSDVNAIESIETAKEGVKNAFNLAGQRVATPTKGLYIVNGKKVVLK